MSINDEEPYSTIFASLKHPIRRRILRMLSKQPMSFTEMVDALGVSNSFLTYHLDNLGELVGKAEDGKYKLSSFGEAANAAMNKVEGIPIIASHNSRMSKTNWFKGRSAVVALGIACILLIAGLGGTIAYYTIAINNKQNELNSMSKTIDQLNATIGKQNDAIDQLKSLLDATPTTVSELVNDTSIWVNRTVVLERNINGPIITPGDMILPYGYQMSSNGQGIGLSFSTSVNLISFYSNRYFDAATFNTTDHGVASTRVYFLDSSIIVRIYGVVKEGEITYGWGMPSQVTYYIEAEEVEMA